MTGTRVAVRKKRGTKRLTEANRVVAQTDIWQSAKRVVVGPTEEAEQQRVVEWFDWRFPRLRGRLLHVPNGGYRRKRQAGILKGQGVRAGVPDLLLPAPRGDYAGLWIEMKRFDGTLSEEQIDWLEFLDSQGYCVVVSWTADPAIAAITWYLEKLCLESTKPPFLET